MGLRGDLRARTAAATLEVAATATVVVVVVVVVVQSAGGGTRQAATAPEAAAAAGAVIATALQVPLAEMEGVGVPVALSLSLYPAALSPHLSPPPFLFTLIVCTVVAQSDITVSSYLYTS
jgi:hypothetical protein